jgi:hypothetical protein
MEVQLYPPVNGFVWLIYILLHDISKLIYVQYIYSASFSPGSVQQIVLYQG